MADILIECPACHAGVAPDAIFCPHCGRKLREELTVWKIISAVFIGLFLPPLGFFTGFRYLKSKDERTRQVGILAIGLTIISLVFTSILTVKFMGEVNSQINSQMQLYNEF